MSSDPRGLLPGTAYPARKAGWHPDLAQAVPAAAGPRKILH
jgi:hypothetical protein